MFEFGNLRPRLRRKGRTRRQQQKRRRRFWVILRTW
jgi:hypothetical protein